MRFPLVDRASVARLCMEWTYKLDGGMLYPKHAPHPPVRGTQSLGLGFVAAFREQIGDRHAKAFR